MAKASQILQDWMLPGAIVLGASLYLLYRVSPPLHEYGHVLHAVAQEGQRIVIALLLFFQFVKISPRDFRFRRWHLWVLLFQVLSFLAFAALVVLCKPGAGRILLECAMLCLICPTASAAGVITDKLGGSLGGTVSYVMLSNLAATFLIPLVIPVVHPSAELGFWQYVGHIALKVFPVLILPGLVAWTIRYLLPRVHAVMLRLSRFAFYIWGVGLTLAILLSTRALVLSALPSAAVLGIVGVSVAACAVQFFFGRGIGAGVRSTETVSEASTELCARQSPGQAPGQASGRAPGTTRDSITAGQALGQKNTSFLIWLGYNYLTPVTSVAGGLYAIWQNLFNSWQLYRKSHPRQEA